jgi:hypothetical protein
MKDKLVEIKVSLIGSEPLIWRTLHVPAKSSLRALHRILQGAMQWRTCHLYMYEIEDQRYGDPSLDDEFEPMWKSDQNKKLFDIFSKVDHFKYIYDFGDGWQHKIQFKRYLDPDPNKKYPLCIDGREVAPPEDCGGLGGFQNLKEALADQNHPEHDEMKEWIGGFYRFDDFDVEIVNLYLPRRKKQITSI